MSHESPEAREHTRNIDLTEVADWHREPGTGLWSFGNELSSVRVDQDSATVPVDQETLALREKVSQHETPTFFSGKFANVEGITLTEHGVQIQTSETDFLTYSITLNEQQFADGRKRATAANRSGERMFYQLNTDDTRKSIEQLFGGKRPIPEWDPNAYFNILYGLDAEKKRTPEELDEMVEQMKQYMSEHPMDYTYPIEKYLSPDLPNV